VLRKSPKRKAYSSMLHADYKNARDDVLLPNCSV
jgi:hypothetical protein